MQAVLIPFLTIFLAEFFDKSQLTILLLASKTKKHTSLVLGALLAFAIVDGIAIFLGAWIATVVPAMAIKLVSSAIFIIFGVLMLRVKHETAQADLRGRNVFFSSFSLVFLSEWGDKTQLAAAAFATRFPPLSVLLGVLLAMTLLSILAVIAGKILVEKVKPDTIRKIAGALFITLGVVFLVL